MKTNRTVGVAWTAALIALALTSGLARQSRDAPPAQPGSGQISGIVSMDDASGKPMRRALVTLGGGRGGRGTTVVTDDEGRFAFDALAPGRYTLSASRPGFVTTAYGATRPGRPGTPVQLTQGQRLAGLSIKMPRGAVVTGTVVDQNGEPLSSARVSLMRYVYSPQNGQRTLQASGGSGSTDDRGIYRIYGIVPGEYLVELNPPFSMPGDMRQTTAQSFQAATQQLQGTAAAPAAADTLAPTVSYAPVFFPGTTTAATASTLKLAAGEERSGIDLQLQLVPTAAIKGTVTGPDGAPAANVQLSVLGVSESDQPSMASMLGMFGGNRTQADGTFSIGGIAPGQYTVAARTASAGRGGGPAAPALWASAEVNMNGQDVTGIRLTLEPGLTLSGRVAFEGASPAPQDLTTVRVTLSPILTGASVAMMITPVQSDAQGRFVFKDVTPGRYRFSAVLGGPTPPEARGAGAQAPAAADPLAGMRAMAPRGIATPWSLKSATLRGRETLDTGADIKAGDTSSEMLLTFTDKITSLSGTLQDASGRPASDYFIIIYAADKAFWTVPSRRVVMTRPASDGKFGFRSLPPGEYLLAAATDIEQGEWMDPSFLAELVPASIKVTLADGEARTQDIRIAAR